MINLTLLALLSVATWADDRPVEEAYRLDRPIQESDRILSLELDPEIKSAPCVANPQKKCVEVTGMLTQSKIQLELVSKNGRDVLIKPTSRGRKFRISVAADVAQQTLEFVASGKSQEPKTEKIILVIPSLLSSGEPSSLTPDPIPSPTVSDVTPTEIRKIAFRPSVSWTSLSYLSESSPDEIKMSSIKVQGDFRWAFLPGPFSLSGGAWTTLLPSVTGRTGAAADIKFAGVDGHLGWRLPFLQDPWFSELLLGFRYRTMLSTGGLTGFQNSVGPDFGWALKRSLGKKHELAIQAYFSNSEQTFWTVPKDNYEYAGRLGWNWQVKPAHSLGLFGDWNRLHLAGQGRLVAINSYSIGLTYSLGLLRFNPEAKAN